MASATITTSFSNEKAQIEKMEMNVQSKSAAKWKCAFLPTRYVIATMCFVGIINVYSMRTNLNVGIVAMVKKRPEGNLSQMCHEQTSTNSTDPEDNQDAEFEWNELTRGLILGVFYLGYMITQIPGGRLAEIYGGKWVFGIGVLCTSIFTLLTPAIARAGGDKAMIALRFAEGFCEGITYPAMYSLLSKWCPPMERSKMFGFANRGAAVGTIFSSLVSGLLLNIKFDNGWPFVFYFYGVIGIIWFLVWAKLVHETPDSHPTISPKEKLYIENSLSGTDKSQSLLERPPVPWRRIFSSGPFWALLISNFGIMCGMQLLRMEVPTYLTTVLNYDVEKSAHLSALPHLGMAVFGMTATMVADSFRQRKVFSNTVIRKFATSLGNLFPAIFLIVVSQSGCNRAMSVSFLVLAASFQGIADAGCLVNHVDISPRFSGTLQGLTNTLSQISGFAVPYMAGYLTNNDSTVETWSSVFYAAAALHIIASLVYNLLASGEEQVWNDPKATLDEIFKRKDPQMNAFTIYNTRITVESRLSDMAMSEVSLDKMETRLNGHM